MLLTDVTQEALAGFLFMTRRIVSFAGLTVLIPGLLSPQSAPVSPAFDVASIRRGQPAAAGAILLRTAGRCDP